MNVQTFEEAVSALRLVYNGKCTYIFNYLSWWQQELGASTQLKAVTPERIDEGVFKLMNTQAFQFKHGIGTIEGKKRRSPATVNRYISVLATMFKFLKQARYLPRSFVSPITRGTKLPEPPGKTLNVSLEDVAKLIAGARLTRNRGLPALVAVACSTGLRKSNVQGLRWGDIDLTTGFVDVQVTKNGSPLRSVLPAFAIDELKRIRGTAGPTDLIFGIADFKRAFASALSHAGLPQEWTIHSMRHIAASILAQSGASLPTIMACLNHRSPSMAIRYSHMNTKSLEVAVAKAWA